LNYISSYLINMKEKKKEKRNIYLNANKSK